MSFQNLTPHWTTQPLTDPALAADVVDLMVTLGERQRGTFAVLLCDPDHRYRGTIKIDLPSHPTPRTLQTADLCTTALDPVIPAVHTAPGTTLLLALGRPGPAHDPTLDTEWATVATHLCEATQVPLLGFYVATAHGVYLPTVRAPAVT